MKRQDIISKLMNEGFTQKTLVNLTDKQLHMLAERILSEQISTISTIPTTTSIGSQQGVTNVSKTDTRTISSLKQQKKPFVAYEGEVKEQEKVGIEKKKKSSEKENVIKRIKHKIETKMKKDECIKSEIELLKRMGEEIPENAQKYYNKRIKKVEKSEVSESNKNVKKIVNKLIENKITTTKDEIINLIQSKLNEQEVAEPPVETDVLPDFLTYSSITSAQPAPAPAKPTTKPGKPSQKPNPRTPYQPGPGINPRPKAQKQ